MLGLEALRNKNAMEGDEGAGAAAAAAAQGKQEGKKGVFDSGGVLANSNSDVAELGDGDARIGMLLALLLYQRLPQFVPKTVVTFPAALGATATKTIELRNPSRMPIEYEVRRYRH